MTQTQQPKGQHKPPELWATIWENVKQIGIAVLLAVLIKTSIVEAYKIPSQSMEDTLLVGDFLLANKLKYGARLPLVDWQLPSFRDPEPGDVVIFIYPRDGITKYIKRCVAVGGDTVEVRAKQLFVNGQEFPNPDHSKFIEPRILERGPGGSDSRDNFGPYVVPRDHYFMMGDNRDNSYDSRYWGPVHKRLVLGQAILVHWSWDDEAAPSPEVSLADPLSIPRLFTYNAVHFFEKVRWSRLMNLVN
ncbi:MAG: signal peptidase I [bacterium]